jgi:hypothetical protein
MPNAAHVISDPSDWPALLLACMADDAAGAKTMPEFVDHRARRAELIRAVGRYAEAKGWPRVMLGSHALGPGAGLWCDFLFGVEDPAFLGDAMLQLDAA